MLFDLEMIKKTYARYPERIEAARAVLKRPLTLAEKILYAHLVPGGEAKSYKRGDSFAEFHPDRVAMQDATAQMALLQFMTANREQVAIPSSIHCDHLIVAKSGAAEDLQRAMDDNREVYDFLESVAARYGIDFWKPGAGIIHQVVLENYAFPGGMMIGTDSHTVNAGGLGMVAIGVGGADAVDAMVALPWELKYPQLIGVRLKGKLRGFASPKDVILKLAGILTTSGGTNCIIEYFGPGARSLSATGKGTICNMGAEVGATCSTFPYDEAMKRYLQATGRAEVAAAADAIADHLVADPEVEKNPGRFYDRVVEIDLDALQPHYNGPYTPDRAFEISEMKESLLESDSMPEVSAALIGSCTNSSYEDLSRAASLAKQAIELGVPLKSQLIINPGSEQVRATAERDGLLGLFEKLGAQIMANACGPCIGMWNRAESAGHPRNTIVHSFNRNFAKRADGNPNTHAFVSSPEMAMVAALSGTLLFNPERDLLKTGSGKEVKLTPPTGDELPPKGFAEDLSVCNCSKKGDPSVEVKIDPQSQRLQRLLPFETWDGEDIIGARLLIKAKGKCTTDHISMAGPWLKFRGHLENISNNLLIGAVNAFGGTTNSVVNQLTGERSEVPQAARAYKQAGVPSIVVGDQNYGEGSSREHAAMEPRFMGVRAVITRSFARIHETNLKKQGMLALTFANPDDYEKVREDDLLDILGLKSAMEKGTPIALRLNHSDGQVEEVALNHTYNEQQWGWFRAGSAINMMSE